ncbi:MAG: metallopeptidase family protein [Planctomycetota bacterium]
MTSNQDQDDGAYDEQLDQAWEALEDGDPEEALALAASVPSHIGERSLLEGRAYLDLCMANAAAGALARATDARGAEDHDVRALDAELRLLSWDLAGARKVLDQLADEAFDVDWWERRALLADLAGEHHRAEVLLVEARREAPELVERPVRVTDEVFDQVVEEALASLPEAFQRAVSVARIVREPMPWVELAGPEPLAVPPDVLGLFVGPTLHELAEERSGELPPVIYLFKRNIERASSDREELFNEIRITLFHEIGHLLGLDEDEVAAMGLE